jgi:hypothetical protein
MGYTVYWVAKPVDGVTMTEWINAVRTVIDPTLKIHYEQGSLTILGTSEPFYATLDCSGIRTCTTGNQPYTADCMKAMVLMVEYGLATEIFADDMEGFMGALEAVNSLIPLQTYEAQKTYFEEAGLNR